MPELQGGWGIPMVYVICGQCDWRYLAPDTDLPEHCPHCAAPALARLDADEAQFPYPHPPELVVPFEVAEAVLAARVEAFARGIPFVPTDLNPATLRERMQKLYLPMWLVDSDVVASWQAEVGFDYEVVSHQGRYADGAGWRTEEVREGRVRWEPRVGQLRRHYDNVAAPALGLQEAAQRALGRYNVSNAGDYSAEHVRTAIVRAPDRSPEAAWPDAEVGLRQRAADECCSAAHADHIRDFRWAPEFGEPNWTLLLLPVYATFYRDDEGQPQRVLINGQTGQLSGVRRGSMKRAQRTSLVIGIVALVLFLLSVGAAVLGAMVPPALAIGVVGAVMAVLIGIGAIIPIARVWSFNRRESRATPEV